MISVLWQYENCPPVAYMRAISIAVKNKYKQNISFLVRSLLYIDKHLFFSGANQPLSIYSAVNAGLVVGLCAPTPATH
ncbi:hypothetical protein A9Q99_01740 [Gammaproteobacteria bacterium 45_16_T64]|nr:hypothetical protein A9Q99_01740 [Gammaproteobacteria bacterium 45_16_T64]